MIVLSDTHISAEVAGKKAESTKSVKLLQEAVKQANESDADIVIFAGDNVDNPGKEDLVVFAKIISKLNKPYYVIPGNHDLLNIQGIDKKEFYRLLNRFSANKINNVPYVETVNSGLVLIFMDGANQYMPNNSGYFKGKDLIWLDEQLKKHKNRKVVIVQHFPLIEHKSNGNRLTHKIKEYRNVLSAHQNVIAIISGHEHYENEIQQDGILHISLPSLLANREYKEINITYGRKKTDFLIKSKIHSIE